MRDGVDSESCPRLPGAHYEFRDANDVVVVQADVGDDGMFDLMAPVMAPGLAGRHRATAATYWPTNVFRITRPLVSSEQVNVPMASDGAVMLQQTLLMRTIDETKGIGYVAAADCDGYGFEGATLDIDGPYDLRVYAGTNGLPDPTLTATSTVGGAFFINVAPGPFHGTVMMGSRMIGTAEGRVYMREISSAVVFPQ